MGSKFNVINDLFLYHHVQDYLVENVKLNKAYSKDYSIVYSNEMCCVKDIYVMMKIDIRVHIPRVIDSYSSNLHNPNLYFLF